MNKRQEGETAPTNYPSASIDAESENARGTHFLLYKPISVPGLYSEAARGAIAVAMDDPSGGLQFPH
jgi:hypothetical protein